MKNPVQELAFNFSGQVINNPYLSTCQRYAVDPVIYGFAHCKVGGHKLYRLPLRDGTQDVLVLAGVIDGTDASDATNWTDAPEPALWDEAVIARLDESGCVLSCARLAEVGH